MYKRIDPRYRAVHLVISFVVGMALIVLACSDESTGPSEPPSCEIGISPDLGFTPLMVTCLADVTGGEPPLTYRWELGDGAWDTSLNAEYYYVTPGTLDIVFTVTDSDNRPCSTSQQLIISDGSPVAQFEVVYLNSTAYVGDTIRFDAGGSYDPNHGDFWCNWSLSDGTIAIQTVLDHVFASPGTYEIELVVIDQDALFNRSSTTLNILPLPR